jgi:hypothetical protein
LADNDPVTGLNTEGGRHVRGEVLVALLVTGVLGDEVEVFATDDKGTCVALSVSAKPFPVSMFPNLSTQNLDHGNGDIRCILVVCTTPVRIRPRMETIPVKGHFLSMYEPSMAVLGVRKPRPTSLYHLLLRVFLRGPVTLWLRKMCGCASN